MNKKKIVKLGVCSLLVSLLALTACSKKKTTKEATTVKPTTKSTPTTTNKSTTKRTTTQNTTTEAQKEVIGYRVYVDNEQTEESLKLEYGSVNGYRKHLRVEKVFSDNSTKEMDMNEYEIEKDFDSNSDLGNYSITIKYGNYDNTVIPVEIVKAKLDVSNLKVSQTEFVYDGKLHYIYLENSRNLPSDIITSSKACQKTDAGTYHGSIELSVMDSAKFELVNIPEALKDIEWTIKKGDAKIISITNPTKTFDGNAVELDYETNFACDAEILYKKKGDDDSLYSNVAPVDAGEYTAKIVIADTDNYNGTTQTIDFKIRKLSFETPHFDNANNIAVYKTDTTYNVLDYFIGFDSEYMELDSNFETATSQSEAGKYSYKAKVKDEYISNVEILNNEVSNWVIQGDFASYVASATIDDVEVDDLSIFDTIETLEPYSVYKFVLKDGFDAYIDGDLDTYTIELHPRYNETNFRIVTEGGSADDAVFVRKWFCSYYGMDYLTVNGKKYQIAKFNYNYGQSNYIEYVKNSDNTIKIGFYDLDDENIKVYYNKDYQEYVFKNGEEKIIDLGKSDDLTVTVTWPGHEGFDIKFREKNAIKAFDLTLYDLETHEISNVEVAYDEKANTYHYNDDDLNKICIGIDAIFNDEYNDATYALYDDKNNLFTFDTLQGYYYLTVRCQKDDLKLRDITLYLNVGKKVLEKELFYETIHNSFVAYTSNNQVTLPNHFGYSLYIDGVESNDRIINESSKGIFEHIIEYKHTIDGKEFVYKAKIFVVNSDNIFDYASEAGFSYKEYGSTYNAFVTDDDEDIINIVDRYESVNVRNLRDYDSPFAECINGYTLNSEKSTYGFTDLTKKDSLFYIKYVFEKDGNEKEVYVFVDYYGDVKNDTSIIDEVIQVSYQGSMISEEFEIVDDIVNITTPREKGKISFYLNDIENKFELIDSNGISKQLSSSYSTKLVESQDLVADTYTLRITTDAGVVRNITINLVATTKMFGISRALDTEGYELFVGVDGSNMKINLDDFGMTESVVGYFGDDKYIVDDTIDINITGMAINALYKDYFLTKPVKENDTLDVYYDDNNKAYITLYMSAFGKAEIKMYLCEKEKPEKYISFGKEFYEINLDGTTNIGELLGRGEEREYFLNTNDYYSSFTLTLSKVYDDYSYVVFNGSFYDLFDYNTFEEAFEAGVAYKVTDSTTLSVEVPLYSNEFFIFSEGTTEFDRNKAISITIQNINIFEFEINGKTYYEHYKSQIDSYNGTEETNADYNYAYYGEPLSESLLFVIGEAERANVKDGKYKIKVNPGITSSIYVGFLDNKIDLKPDENGMIELEYDDEYKECEFYIDVNMGDGRQSIRISLIFENEFNPFIF